MELFATEFLHSQVFWTGVAFAVLLGVMAKFVVPAVDAVLAARASQIRADLDAANKARAEAEKVFAEYSEQMAKAKKEAAQIVSQARAEAEALANDRIKKAEQELAHKAEMARQSIETAKEQAIKDVRDDVAALSLSIAESLVHDKVDAKLATKLTDAALKRGMN